MKHTSKTKRVRVETEEISPVEKSEPIVKKKKKSVKFQEVDSDTPKPVKKARSDVVITSESKDECEAPDDVDSVEKHQRNRKKKAAKKQRKLRSRNQLADEILAPVSDTVEFMSQQKNFSDFDLDERILKSIGEMGWKVPTQVQESVIGLALENKNIMARARTGSGKTAAFLLPTLQKVVQHISASPDASGPFVMYVAPTKELATQIFNLLSSMLSSLPFINALNLSELSVDEKELWEKDSPALVVTTPGKLVTMLNIRPTFCQNVRHLVLDEADLLLSFGYEGEMIKMKEHLPQEYQCILTSATLKDDMSLLKKLFMTGPVVTIKLKEADLPDADQLNQYHITCADDDQRFTMMVSMLKLRLIVGKTIIFVNTIDRGFRLSLVLETMGLSNCVLNSEMPANSRCHVIEMFNSGRYDVIIASDSFDNIQTKMGPEEKEDEKDSDPPQDEEGSSRTKNANAKLGRRDKEAGVARGIDFHHVANVVNFDFPTTTDIYVHRVGRTARGWNKGTALSFCGPHERKYLNVIQEDINEQLGRKVIMPYEIRLKELDSFYLRTREALRKASDKVVKEARMREIKLELIRSDKLKGFFAANPREGGILSKVDMVRLKVHSSAIADVPSYMVPKALRGMDFSSKKTFTKRRPKVSHGEKKFKSKMSNPLKSFKLPAKKNAKKV